MARDLPLGFLYFGKEEPSQSAGLVFQVTYLFQ
jgi:hypothetical protein